MIDDVFVFFFQAEDGIRDHCVTGVQTCALPISPDLLFTDSQPSDDTELDMPDIPVYAQRQVIITNDNAADFKGAVEESSMLHMRCYAHTINLSVQFTYCFVWTFYSLR